MAGLGITYTLQVTPDQVVRTLAQFLVHTNGRYLLHGIDIRPGGVTGATAPILYHLGTQSTAGSANDDSSALIKRSPSYSQTLQCTVQKTFTAEPAATTIKHKIGQHEQSPIQWRPTDGKPIVMESAERWGLVMISGTLVSTDITFYLEE